MAVLTKSPPKIDIYQPGLEQLRKVLSRSSLSQGQVNDLLFHLDTKNYLFVAFAIAQNSLPAGSKADINQLAQNLISILKVALDLSQEDLGLKSDVVPVSLEMLDRLASQPEKATQLYQEFENEYPREQTRDLSNYQDTRGGRNPLLDHVSKKVRGKVDTKLREIWSNFRNSLTGKETESFLSVEAAGLSTTPATTPEAAILGGSIAGTLVPTVITTPSSTMAIVSTNIPGIAIQSRTAAAAGGRLVGFSMSSDVAQSVIGQELVSFGLLQRVPTAGVSQIFGVAAKGSEFWIATPKGISMALKFPKIASLFNYVATTAGVTTFTTTTGTTGGVVGGTAVGTIAGTAAGGALGTGTGTVAGGAAGTVAGGAAGVAAGGTAGAATGGAAGAAVGGPVGIITAIIGAVLGFLASLIPKYKEEIEAMVFGGGFLLLSSLNGIALGPSFLLGVGAGGAFHSIRGGTFGAGLSAFFYSLLSAIVVSLTTPLLIIFIGVPLFIVFIHYIITTSSYVTPYNPIDLTIVPLAGGPGGVPAPGPGGYVPPPGPGVPGPTINPWPPPGSRPPPGPGSEYPHCWPLRARITQLPGCDGNPAHATWSHCCYLVGNTCTRPSEPVWNAYDIGASAGTPVYATHDGLACAIVSTTGWGNLVTVTSPVGFQTYYAHLLGFTFSGCVNITGGTQIGTVDNTGNSTGDHLHYGITGGSLIQQVVPQIDQNISLYQTPQGCVANNPPPSTICQWPNYCIFRPIESCNPGDTMTDTLICDPTNDQYFCCVHATPTPSPQPPPLPTPI